MYLTYRFTTGQVMYFGLLVGMVIGAVGAYAEKANALKIKPFDNSYKKARESYKNKDEPNA